MTLIPYLYFTICELFNLFIIYLFPLFLLTNVFNLYFLNVEMWVCINKKGENVCTK